MDSFTHWAGHAGATSVLLAVTLVCRALPSPAADPAGASTDVAGRRTVVVLGDSLAAGYGLDPEESYPALLQGMAMRAGLEVSVINAGVSGDTTAGGLRRLDWLLKRPVDVLVLALGGNDGLRGIPAAVTRTNLQAIIERTKQRYPGAKVVLAGMQMPPNMGEEYRQSFARIFPEVAKGSGAVLVPFLLEGVGGRPELNQPDQIHPTAEGQKILAQNVWKVLRPVLAPPG